MDDFLLKFFPSVYRKKHEARENNYCKYDNQMLQLFTSSLYLAAVVFSFVAAKICTRFGRRMAMRLAAAAFGIGVILNIFARNVVMLIVGRLFLGAGVGMGNQVIFYILTAIIITLSMAELHAMLVSDFESNFVDLIDVSDVLCLYFGINFVF